MSENKQTVQKYMDGFVAGDHETAADAISRSTR